MTRTFHARVSKKVLIYCLMPSTILTVYFFWIKMPLAALVFMIFMVVIIERMIHTSYIINSGSELIIFKGRFSRVVKLRLSDIEKVEQLKSTAIFPFRRKDVVTLTLKNGSIKQISPFPADEFCRYVERCIKDLEQK